MPLKRTPKKKHQDDPEAGAFELLLHQRDQIEEKVMRINNILENAEEDSRKPSASLLKVYTKKLEMHYNEYTALHAEVISSATADQIEEQDSMLNRFDALHTDALDRLEKLLLTLQDSESNETKFSQQFVVQQPSIRAPVPYFDGQSENWPKFKAMFEDIVVKTAESDAMKLHHLDKALIGDAAGLINARMIRDNNFNQVWKELIEQFENPRVIVDTHLDGLINLKPMVKGNYKNLLELVKSCDRHVAGLEYQGIKLDTLSGLLITKLVVSRLDDHTLQQWERTQEHGKLPDYRQTIKFLKGECQVLERLSNVRPSPSPKETSNQSRAKSTYMQSHTVTSSNPSNNCQLCKEDHRHFECPKIHEMTVNERIAKVKELRWCFNCLRPGHRVIDCSSKKCCMRCRRKHHTLLHEEMDENPNREPNPPVSNVASNDDDPNPSPSFNSDKVNPTCSSNHTEVLKTVMLLTAIVHLECSDGKMVPCRTLLDSGSQASFVSERMASQLFLPREYVSIPISGVGGSKSYAKQKLKLSVHSRYSSFNVTIECLVVPKVTANLPSSEIDISSWQIPSGIQLADPTFYVPDSIDLLIGASCFFDLLKSGRLHISDNLPDLHDTHFGWVFAGEINGNGFSQDELLSCHSTLDETIKKFWEIEEIPNSVSTEDDDNVCEKSFRSTHTRTESGRFIVQLPFLETDFKLPNNKEVALRRFCLLEKRFERDPQLKTQYQQFISEYKQLGHCRQVSESDEFEPTKYFLPHHAVLRPNSSTTKCRVVFDASSKQFPYQNSLNEVLLVGPTIQSELFDILLRFRKHFVVFTADIAKMYRQVLVDPQHTCFQRIFWRDEPNQQIQTLELSTVTYGTASAPFLATSCQAQLCYEGKHRFPIASRVV